MYADYTVICCANDLTNDLTRISKYFDVNELIINMTKIYTGHFVTLLLLDLNKKVFNFYTFRLNLIKDVMGGGGGGMSANGRSWIQFKKIV